MNHWKPIGLSLLLAILGTAVCAGAAEAVVVSEEQNGGSVTLEQGQQMTLTLPGNPSTGYQWTVPQEIEANLTLHDSSYTPGSDRIGAPGHYTFHFEAQHEGTVNLRMVYARSFETGEANSFDLTIEIIHRPAGNTDGKGSLGDSGKATDPYSAIPESE
jgi:inhibitor of cysteine peptidase